MPIYTVQEADTGRKVTFSWEGSKPPTDEDMTEIFSQARQEDRTPRISQEQGKPPLWQRAADIRQPTATPQGSGGAMPFVNRGISETIGAVPDLIRSAVNAAPGMDASNRLPEPMLGRKSIESGMGSAGISLPQEGQEPQTVPEHIGQTVGTVAGMLNPSTAGISHLAKGVGLTGKVTANIWSSMVKHPYLAMTSELTGAAGAGAGRGGAEQAFPDSPLAQSAIEVTSGLSAAVAPTLAIHAPTAVALRAGKNILNKVILPFTKRGGTYRAGEYAKGLVAVPEKASIEAGTKTISGLPPAVATGEKKIVQLYKSLIGQDPVKDAEVIEATSKSIIKLEGEMRKLGYGSPELLAEITEKRIAALELRMDQRIMTATEKAQTKLELLPVAKRKATEAQTVRQELENAMRIARTDEAKLWLDVDKRLPSGFERTRATYKSLIDNLGNAQKVDIPSELKIDPIIKRKKLTSTTVLQMQSLRSKLLESARIARKDGQWNKARIAGDVADAILEDLGIVGEDVLTPGAANLKAALAFSRNFKTQFESGEVGKLLGYSKSGAPAINPDLTLEMTIGRMGERGAIDIEKVVVTSEAHAATQRWLGRSFTDYATDPKTGVLNPIKSERWVKNNEAILDKFPGLRTKLTNAAETQRFADETSVRMQARKKALRDPRISESAKYLNKVDMGTEIQSILNAPHPALTANALVRQANKDTSGNALAGLRAGFVEHILENSYKGSFDNIGQQRLSGGAMLNFINKNEPMLKQVFDSDKIARMKQVGTELSKIETLEKIRPGDTDIEMKDWASSSLNMFGRLTGAKLGGKIGSSSMGGSLQYASIFSSRGKKFMTWLSKDTAQQLIHDAILSEDPALLQSLLKPIAKPTPNKKDLIVLNKNLNLWLLSTGERVLDNIETE